MKRCLILFAALAMCVVSCGTVGEFADSDRFQDGIYYKPNPKGGNYTPKTAEDFKYEASLGNYSHKADTLTIIADEVNIYEYDPFWSSSWSLRFGYPYYGYYHWSPYRWGYYSHFGYSYWGYPYYWDYYGWYGDPFYWDYYYGYPYYSPWYYGGGWYGYGYGRGYNDAVYTRRSGSATSGIYSRSKTSYHGIGTRTASSAASRDISHLSSSRATPRTTAVNRASSVPETQNYRVPNATRANNSASYYRDRNSTSHRYESGSSSRSMSSSRSSGYSGGGYSGGSHSGGGMSHSSGGSYHGGGGHR